MVSRRSYCPLFDSFFVLFCCSDTTASLKWLESRATSFLSRFRRAETVDPSILFRLACSKNTWSPKLKLCSLVCLFSTFCFILSLYSLSRSLTRFSFFVCPFILLTKSSLGRIVPSSFLHTVRCLLLDEGLSDSL